MSQTGTPAYRPTSTLAEVLSRLEGDRSLDAKRRAMWTGAIRTMSSILNRPADAIPASLPEIQRLLDEVPLALRGRSDKTVKNTRSRIKAALLYVAEDQSLPPRGAPLSANWAALQSKLVEARHKKGLTRLMGLASHHGIAPTAMSDSVITRFVGIVARVNGGRAAPFHRSTVILWNECRSSIPGWPDIVLTPPTVRARTSYLPLANLPDSFQRDLAAYLAWEAGSDPLADDGPPKPLKKSTLRGRKNHLHAAASHLAGALGGPQRVPDLKTLVDPQHVKTVIKIIRPKDEGQPSALLHGIVLTLVTVAKRWVKPEDSVIKELVRLKGKVKAPTGMTAKNRHFLNQIDDPRLVKALLDLPAQLRRQADTLKLTSSQRLAKVQTALAIDLLVVAPIRMGNLMALELDRHLRWPNGRGGSLILAIREEETKNERLIEFDLPTRIATVVADYVDRMRDPAHRSQTKHLFLTREGRPLPSATMSDRIGKAIFKGLGVRMTPHQFRHFAAKIALDAHPEAFGLVKDLLGHRNLKTTINAYAGMRTKQASKAYDRMLEDARNQQLAEA